MSEGPEPRQPHLIKRLWARRRQIEKQSFAVGGPLLTLLFWSICAIFLVALWRSPVLPFGDYNYHLSLGAILRRAASPGSPEHALYATNLVTYNGGFQIAVAVLGFVMPMELASLFVFSGTWIGLCLVVIALLRALEQPTERAFIVFPLFLAMSFAWGFINFNMGLVLLLWALSRAIRRPRVSVPIRYDAVTGLLTMLGLLSHLMSTAIGFMLIFITLVARTMADRRPIGVSYLRTLREGLAYLPTIALGVGIYFHQRSFQSRYGDNYIDFYAVDKVKSFFDVACDYYADHGDRPRLEWAVGLLVPLFLFRSRLRAQPYPSLKGWLLVSTLAVYLLMPSYWWHISVLEERVPMICCIFFALAVPRANAVAEKLVAVAVAVVGIQCATAFYGLRAAQLPDLRDFARVIDDAPPRRRLTIHAQHTALERQAWPWAGHLAPYYITRRRGLEVSVNYANIPSNPVWYRNEAPPLAPDAVAQGGTPYNPNAPYARRFDLVLVRTTNVDPAKSLWGARWGEIDLVSHHGFWWLFDARRYYGNQP